MGAPPGGDIRPCRCRKLHEPTDPLIGTPLNPATYDYTGAVLFNAHAGALRTRFTTYLRRELAARLGMTQKAAHAVPGRGGSTATLGALRDARRTWRTEQARAHAGPPEHDPTTTLVVGHWAYLGSGYSPGAALLAAHVWHSKELERQFVAEGGC
ncbi:replication initiator [Streptomyces sp. NPDC002519]